MRSFLKQIRYAVEAVLAYFFYLLFWIMGLNLASYVGGRIGRFVGPGLKVSNNARRNLKYAMPELSDEEIKKIIADMWENLGRVVGELPHLRRLKGQKFWQHVELHNDRYLKQLRDEYKTGIVVSGHFANWEFCPKSAIEYGMQFSLIYRHANNPWLEKLIQFSRNYMEGNISKKGREGAKSAITTLKNRGFLGIVVDQKMNDGIETTFFGKKAMSAPAAAELALKFHCPILPVLITRTEGPNFKISFPGFIDTDGKEAGEIIQEINDLFESWIRQNPAQWLWLHNRWPKDAPYQV